MHQISWSSASVSAGSVHEFVVPVVPETRSGLLRREDDSHRAHSHSVLCVGGLEAVASDTCTFMKTALELARDQVRDGLPLRASIDGVGFRARKPG